MLPPFAPLIAWRPGWPQVRQAFQTMVAAVTAYAIATYAALPQGYWSVMTAILVVQSSVGASLGLAIDRLLATVLGGAVGALLVASFGDARLPLLAVSVLVLSYVATSRASLRLAPVTAVIVILSDPHYGSSLASAVNRVLEIGIGALIAVVTTLVVFPSRAGAALAAHVGRTLPLFATHLEGTIDATLGKPRAFDDFVALNVRVRAALIAGEGLASEARRELAGRVSDHADPAAVLRTMRRLWYTLMMSARAVQSDFRSDAVAPLSTTLATLREVGPALIRQLAGLYDGNAVTIDPSALDRTLATFDEAMAGLRSSGRLRPLSTEEASRIFTFAFALGQLSLNLKDLSDRHADLMGATASAPVRPG